MAGANRQARLACPGVGTLRLPWWPTDVTRTGPVLTWDEQDRPGRAPLRLVAGRRPAEYRVGFVLRREDPRQSVADYLLLLDRIATARTPSGLYLGSTRRGLYTVDDLSVVEVRHGSTGVVSVADVSCTLKASSPLAVRIGPVPARRNPKPPGHVKDDGTVVKDDTHTKREPVLLLPAGVP